MIEMNPQNKNSIIIHYDICLACNNKCSYCYKLKELDNTKFINDEIFEETIQAINLLKKQHPEYNITVVVLGGEPLMVIDKLIEFVERIYSNNIKIQIFSNMNFEPSSQPVQKIINFYKRFPNFELIISWHKNTNIERIKTNILQCQDFAILSLLLSNDNLEDIYNDMLWIIENTTLSFGIENIRDEYGISTFNLFDDEKYIEITQKADKKDGVNILDNILYNNVESKKLDFLNIAKKYYTICQISRLSIDWYGNIKAICDYPYRSNIKKGIKILDLYCNKYSCKCTTETYKKLIKVRNNV